MRPNETKIYSITEYECKGKKPKATSTNLNFREATSMPTYGRHRERICVHKLYLPNKWLKLAHARYSSHKG